MPAPGVWLRSHRAIRGQEPCRRHVHIASSALRIGVATSLLFWRLRLARGILYASTTALRSPLAISYRPAPSRSPFPAASAPVSESIGFPMHQISRMRSTAGGADDAAESTGLSVAVIGAGAAGLAAGRVLRDEGLRVTIFEKSHFVGGVWRYDPDPGAKAPMYRSLVTNLPKETMSFFGLPWPAEHQSFTTHSQVLDYLCSYADEHDLRSLIKVGCPVQSVRPLELSTPPATDSDAGRTGSEGQGPSESKGRRGRALERWEVVYTEPEARDVSNATGRGRASVVSDAAGRMTIQSQGPEEGGVASGGATEMTETFDAVCVCNGHFDEPFTPTVQGLDDFRGTSMHARSYDTPDTEAFIRRRVLCVGSRSSGTDIAREVSSVADVVHVCDRSASASAKGGERDNVWWRPGLDRFEGANGVRFRDGTLVEVDTVVWCTGYSYSFPFLEGSGLLTPPMSERVHPLYEQLFHVRYPSLSFVGLPQSVVPFPMFEIQANAVAAVLTGRASLPPQAEREQWLLEESQRAKEERGVDPTARGVHVLGGRQWAYSERLLRLAGDAKLVGRAPGHRGHVEDSPGGDEEVLGILKTKQAIYEDASGSRPPFPGGPDDYRRRMYHVDWARGDFSVTIAERKANGEGPSAPTPA